MRACRSSVRLSFLTSTSSSVSPVDASRLPTPMMPTPGAWSLTWMSSSGSSWLVSFVTRTSSKHPARTQVATSLSTIDAQSRKSIAGANPWTYWRGLTGRRAGMWIPAFAPSSPVIQVLGAPLNSPSSNSSGYSPRFQTFLSLSCAKKDSSVSTISPSLLSVSQTTRVLTSSISLVRSVTMKSTRCGTPSTFPSRVICVPGTKGRNLFLMRGRSGKSASSKRSRCVAGLMSGAGAVRG